MKKGLELRWDNFGERLSSRVSMVKSLTERVSFH